MASQQDQFFKVNGAKELAQELKELSRGMQNQILRPALRAATAEVRKVAKTYVPVKSGLLKRSIKNKVFTAKRGAKGVVGRIGVFVKGSDVSGGTHPAKYGAALEYGTESAGKGKDTIIGARRFLANALKASEPIATSKLVSKTQERMDNFHAKQASKYK
jgi:HK97 gp10 family phage protein